MKNDIAAAARLAAQTTYYDAAQSAEIRELLTRLPAEIERLTAELAARAPADASGQIASLKDHLRIADSLLRGYRGAAVALTGCAEGLDDSDVIATLRAHPSAAPADAPLMRAALTSICHGDRMGLDAAALAQIARDWLDAPAADASLEARAEDAWHAWDRALPAPCDLRWEDFHPAAKDAWSAVVRAADASSPETATMRAALTAVGFPAQDGEALDKTFARAWEWCVETAQRAQAAAEQCAAAVKWLEKWQADGGLADRVRAAAMIAKGACDALGCSPHDVLDRLRAVDASRPACDTCGGPATKTGTTGTFCDLDADACSHDIPVDASRSVAPTLERTFPRVTLGSVTPGSLFEVLSGDIGLVLDGPTVNGQRPVVWVDPGHVGTMPTAATVSLRATPAELDALTSADASRPGLAEVPGVVFDVLDKARAFVEPFAARHNEAAHLAETTCRACRAETMIAEIEGAQEECRLVEKRRPGLAEEQVRARAWERLRTAATAAVETFEDSDCDETLEPVFEALDEALAGLATAEEESASRGETGPAAAARAKRRAQCEIDPDCALDPDHQGICDMRPPGHPAPTGLTRAMHDAAQRPSVPPRIEYEHGPDGETYRVEDDWQPCACGAAVSRGEAHPTGPGHDVDWSAVDRQRATPHAGAPASLADVVAASAREPHADVVLHALHVSGGAAAIGVESPVRDPRVDYSADMRPAVTGGECSRCLHAPPLHEATCPTLREPAVLGGHGYVSAGDRFREQLAGDRHVEAGGCKDPDCDWCDNDPDCHAPREP